MNALPNEWEQRLKTLGLSMERGQDPHVICYGFSERHLSELATDNLQGNSRRRNQQGRYESGGVFGFTCPPEETPRRVARRAPITTEAFRFAVGLNLQHGAETSRERLRKYRQRRAEARAQLRARIWGER